MIRGIKFASVPVRDQDRALAFYTERLGLTVATDQPYGDGQRWLELRIPGADTRLVVFRPERDERIGTFTHIAFWTDDVRRSYETLLARGVEFLGPPQEEDWGSAAMFKDPDGNTFVLSSK